MAFEVHEHFARVSVPNLARIVIAASDETRGHCRLRFAALVESATGQRLQVAFKSVVHREVLVLHVEQLLLEF